MARVGLRTELTQSPIGIASTPKSGLIWLTNAGKESNQEVLATDDSTTVMGSAIGDTVNDVMLLPKAVNTKVSQAAP